MQKSDTVENCHTSHIDKWLTLGVMQRVEQVRHIAEMLMATMEDLSDHLETVQSAMEDLTEETNAIDDRIDELMNMIQENVDLSSGINADIDMKKFLF